MQGATFDILIVGGGPGGYTAALRAASHGASVALVEDKKVGGTCLHQGCIPSKALLQCAHIYQESQKLFGTQCPLLALKDVHKRKQKYIDTLYNGLQALLAQKKVTRIEGRGSAINSNTVHVHTKKGEQTLQATKAVILATGSSPFVPEGIKLSQRVLTSDGALSLEVVPETLLICGAGYIGLELGLFWQRMGAQVTLIEAGERLLPTLDADVATTLHKALEAEGLHFMLRTSLVNLKESPEGVTTSVGTNRGEERLKSDRVILALGRRPMTNSVWSANVHLKTDVRGFIHVDNMFQTSTQGIYAIGDLIPGPMLAHKAERDAEILIDALCGHKTPIYTDALIPSVIYTDPGVASVGFSEDELKAQGVPFVKGKAFYSANGRAQAAGYTTGFLKVLAHKGIGTLLGVHIVGEQAETLIAEGCLALTHKLSVSALSEAIHAHPTFSELYREAAQAALTQLAA